MDIESPKRSMIVIGASSGGVEALTTLVAALPPDLAAAIFVVLHVGEVSYLPEILSRSGPLPTVHPKSGDPVRRGVIYVAPPGRHMLVHKDQLVLRRGPRENLSRPAIDPLFRSVACSCGPRTIGVILTGSLGDGAAGLLAVKLAGA